MFVMDHFFQLPMLGDPDQEMFESYTLLGALAARTERVRLGTLVTGVTYRQPALLAKVVTALDVISQGRAMLGIGAAWFEAEHAALGFEFPPLRVRYEHLVDALEICRGMFTQHATTYAGTHHAVEGCVQLAGADRRRHPDPDRRAGRAEDVQDRRSVRGRAQHHRRLRRAPAQARRPPRSPR